MTSPARLGRGAYGGTMCGPVFQQFMTKAVAKYGGGEFRRATGWAFHQDRPLYRCASLAG